MSYPQFSIIIPAYNDLELAKNAVYSVLKQQNIDFEIIMVDDSSQNKIESWIKTIKDQRIKYYHNVPSLGAVSNWNRGLGLAQGENIILLHHDEFFSSDKHLYEVNNVLSSSNDVVITKVKVYIQKEQRLRIVDKIPLLWNLCLKFPTLLFVLNVIGPTACVAFKRHNTKNFNTNLRWLVDVEWYYRMLKNKKKIYLKDLHIHSQHNHTGQISKEIDIKQTNRKDIELLKSIYRNNLWIRFLLSIRNR